MGKGRTNTTSATKKKQSIAKHVTFTYGRTSPNDTHVELVDNKNSAKVGIDTPSVGYSKTHQLYEDEHDAAFLKPQEFEDARKEARKLGQIDARGNIKGEHAHPTDVRANTRANANIAKDVKRASTRRSGNGKGFKKRRYTKKNRK